MSELRRITAAELRLLIRGAKARNSGTILIETPLAQAVLVSPSSSGTSLPDGGWYWQYKSGPQSLSQLVDALGRGPAPGAASLAAEVLAWQAEDPSPRFRDGRTTAMLGRLLAAFEEVSLHGTIVVEVADAMALDRHLLHLLRSILDRADRIRASFLVHFSPPTSFASAPTVAGWAFAVAGLLDLCVKSRMWNRAGLVLDELMRHLHDLPDDGLRGHVLFRAGMAAVRQGRTRDAEAFYERSCEQLTSASDNETLVKALNNLGNLRLGDRRLESAESCFARALKLGEELQSDYHLAVTYGNYARLWLERGHPDQAQAQLQKSIIFTVRSGYYHHSDYTYAILGDVLARRGENSGAETMMRRAVRICEWQENLGDLASSEVRLGRFLADQRRFSEAEACFETADGLYRKLGSSFGRMTLNENLAALRLAQGDLDGARRHWQDAEKVAHELSNSSAMARLMTLKESIDAAAAAGGKEDAHG